MKVRHALFALVTVTLFAACSSVHLAENPFGPMGYTEHEAPVGNMPEVVPVYVDKKFTDAHREAIHSAFAQWNLALNGYEEFKIVSDTFDMEPAVIQDIMATSQGLVVLRRSSTDPIMEEMPEGVLGWVMMPEGSEAHALNLVEDSVGNRDLSSIAMHEIGHTLRLPHLPVKHTLMYPSYVNGSRCIDLFTVQALATVRNWDWHKLNNCAYPL